MTITSLRRLIAAALVWALVAAMAVLAPPAQATANFDFERIFGSDRYATAAQIARDAFPTGAQAAVIATGENFPDALAGSFLAGQPSGCPCPILLVQKNTVPAVTSQALQELGVDVVVLLGGPLVISNEVQTALEADHQVFRLGGQDRFDTARMVAETASPGDIGTVDNKATAIIASGFGFADALAAGPIAYAERLPILLTGPAGLAAPSRTALERLGIDHVVIVGGSAVVSDTVKSEIEQMGITTQRIFGIDRFQTATEIADFAVAEFGFDVTHVNLAKGIDPNNSNEGFADALAGAPHAGEEQAVILLTAPDQLSSATELWIEQHSDTLSDGHIFGGTSAVSDRAKNEGIVAARNLPGEVVRTDTANNRYTYVPPGSNEAPTIDYTTSDTYFVGGTPATIGAFEAAIGPGDQIKYTKTETGARHELTNVTTINGRTIGNIDTSNGGPTQPNDPIEDNEFAFINDVTGDALRNDVKYRGTTDTTFTYVVDGTATDLAGFEGNLSEGDVLTITGTQYSLTNRTISGEINDITVSRDDVTNDPQEVQFKIGPYGDDHATGSDARTTSDPGESGNDTHYEATGGTGETFTMDGQAATFAVFAGAISAGDSVSYSRVGNTETFALTNRSPSTISGRIDSIDPDGDGDGGIIDDDEDGGQLTIDLPDGTTRTVTYQHDGTFVVNGLVSTEAEFEAAADPGDAVVFRGADSATGQTQRVEVTDA